jgi:hypothetical protein
MGLRAQNPASRQAPAPTEDLSRPRQADQVKMPGGSPHTSLGKSKNSTSTSNRSLITSPKASTPGFSVL